MTKEQYFIFVLFHCFLLRLLNSIFGILSLHENLASIIFLFFTASIFLVTPLVSNIAQKYNSNFIHYFIKLSLLTCFCYTFIDFCVFFLFFPLYLLLIDQVMLGLYRFLILFLRIFCLISFLCFFHCNFFLKKLFLTII